MEGSKLSGLKKNVILKDKWFKISQLAFMVVVIFGLGFLTLIQFRVYQDNRDQDRKQIARLEQLLKEQSGIVEQVNKNTTEQARLSLAYIRCIATLIVERDEDTQITIEDLETCQLQLSPDRSGFAPEGSGGQARDPVATNGTGQQNQNGNPPSNKPNPSPQPNPKPEPEPPTEGGLILIPRVCVVFLCTPEIVIE